MNTKHKKQIYRVWLSTLNEDINVEAYTMYEALEKARDIEQFRIESNRLKENYA